MLLDRIHWYTVQFILLLPIFHVMLLIITSTVKVAGLIEMRFLVWTWVDPRNHTLDGGQVPNVKGQFRGISLPIVNLRNIRCEINILTLFGRWYL